jgi:hypothetical protein
MSIDVVVVLAPGCLDFEWLRKMLVSVGGQMAASSGAGVLVYCKGQVAATSLFIVTLTGHVTLVIS